MSDGRTSCLPARDWDFLAMPQCMRSAIALAAVLASDGQSRDAPEPTRAATHRCRHRRTRRFN